MNNMIPIKYREFYDIPRMFVVFYHGNIYLFDCPFNEAKDDYQSHYDVYLMPGMTDKDLERPWLILTSRADSKVAEVPIKEVKFDETLRSGVEAEVLERLNRNNR